MIKELCAYYDRIAEEDRDDLPPLGYSRQKISFCVALTSAGELHAIQDERSAEGKRVLPKLVIVPGQAKPSGSGINPGFLWDNAQYLLGFKPDDPKPERTGEAFAAFRDRHLAAETEVDDPAFSAVCAFLRSWQPQRALAIENLAEIANGFGVFKIVGKAEYVHDRPKVRAYWDRHAEAPEDDAADAVVLPSLIDGHPRRIARLHEPKIKGVVGAQTSGAALVSFNLDAFESYGKSQSYNAPVSEADAFKYCTALNRLTGDYSRRIVLGDTTVVYWAERPVAAESVFTFIAESMPQAEDASVTAAVARCLNQIRQGLPGDPVDDAAVPFYILGLAPNAARLSVRFWLATSVEMLVNRLRQHFADLEIGGAPPNAPPITLQRILDETARERKEISPLLGGALTRAVLTGGPYPTTLLRAVLRRIAVDGRANHVRASIVKACLVRKLRAAGQEETIPVSLNPNFESEAYQFGRLFAVLEKTQEEALPGVNSTIKDRYFSAASANPIAVFPRVLRLHAHHLDKIDNRGRRTNIEKLVQDICSRISADGSFPTHLPLDEQGRFFLGYYHQRQDLFTKKATDSEKESNE